ncbi:tail fiber assembly protein [Enterobacter kobei]|uniref:tail fiber assembly protein n=1 Tax=Enterobacter kobei TaxID=208224 RepID=UPI002F32115E
MKIRYFYDASDNGFYIDHESEVVPESAIEIESNEYAMFAGISWPEGKILGGDESGKPAWLNAPQPTHDESVVIASTKKQALIDQANAYINSKQWPGKAAIGRLKEDELVQYNAWLDYLDSLEVVDTSGAPGINWPTAPEVVPK